MLLITQLTGFTKRLLLPCLIASCGSLAHADDAELKAKIELLTTQLKALQAEVQTLNSKTEAVAAQQENTTPASPAGQSPELGASLWGYGEINYNRPQNNTSDTQMDLRRAVFGIGYHFDERTRLVSEYEIEHAVASSDDAGEVEVEQLYIDHQLGESTHLKAGLFLIPAGLLNDSHEPTSYFGVERNFVETAIIPSTWREGGIALFGSSESGIAWDVGITTTVDLNKWDAQSDEGRESPLGSIHQELQLAKASDLGTYGALNYRGIPGVNLGGSVFTSQVSQGNKDAPQAEDIRLTLWDLHARWTPDKWDLAALYAKGSFSGTAALNATFAGMPTPVPQEFYGWYLQAAYQVWQHNRYALTPFLRYEGFNTASAYAPMPPGLDIAVGREEKVTTAGLSFNLNPKVVIKLDYQAFDTDDSRDRFNLGLGLNY